jgi:hypothetical protein
MGSGLLKRIGIKEAWILGISKPSKNRQFSRKNRQLTLRTMVNGSEPVLDPFFEKHG